MLKLKHPKALLGFLILIFLLFSTFVVVQQQQERQITNSNAAPHIPDEMPENANLPFVDHPELGLRANKLGPCKHLFEVVDKAGKSHGCSHGPDQMPKEFKDHQTDAPLLMSEDPTQVTAGAIVCDGDGVSGYRIQTIYVRASDKPDQYTTFASSFPLYAQGLDNILSESATQTGGVRHFRFVTGSGCSLTVARAVVSATGDDNIGNLSNELKNLGYNRTDRKYLVWLDQASWTANGGVYCGQSNMWVDDQASQSNANNSGGFFSVALNNSQCHWGGWVEAHELMHNLGGVQNSAPHKSGGMHCLDGWDVMCYQDSSTVTMTYPCAQSEDHHYDCRKDDYFHTNPSSGSYLATHWNTASSRFLINGGNTSGECGSAGCCSQVFSGAKCQYTSNACAGGYETNYCPGGTDYKCCKALVAPPPPPPPPPSSPTPTKVPTPTLTPTKIPTPTLTPTKVPTTMPTMPVSLTPTPGGTGTTLNLQLLMHGLGQGGDNVNPQGGGNTNLIHLQRTVVIEVINAQGQQVKQVQGLVIYESSSGSFKGAVDLGGGITSGYYSVKVKMLQSLKKLVPGIQVITAGAINNLPKAVLINGDVNNDNAINIIDFDILLGCYSDYLPAENCTADKKIQSDITDDGSVNQFDYNLFLRELSNLGGQ